MSTATWTSRAHHELLAHEVMLLWETDREAGLTEAEARSRLERYGRNVLPPVRKHGPLVRFLLQFHNPLIYVLLGAATATTLLGEVVDTSVILGVVLVNAIAGYIQESRAEHALESLVAMVRTEAAVLRDHRPRRVPSAEVVPGDVVLLQAGDKVPADLRLVTLRGLQVDESALTGESVPVVKQSLELPSDTSLADRLNMAYSGTLVSAGSGTGVAVATGAETEIGRIHQLVDAAESVATPLTRRIAHATKVLTAAILSLAALTFAVGLLRGEDAGHMLTASVALAVGAIPEGLPAAVTIVLSIGVSRMAKRGAVIRKLPAVETLGSTTVICTDKTGTLTRNEMTVTTVVAGGRSYTVSGTGYEPIGDITENEREVRLAEAPALSECLRAALLCNDTHIDEHDGGFDVVGDPTEGALVVVAAKGGLDAADERELHPRLDAIPFESERQYMATLHSGPDGPLVIVKGAVERVVSLCVARNSTAGTGEPLEADDIMADARSLATEPLRVLAIAQAAVDHDVTRLDEQILADSGLRFLGLIGMHDPPRPAAAAAVRACLNAGIEVKMITGDHVDTARAIAEQIGLGASDAGTRAMTSKELSELSPDDLVERVAATRVFARVTPEQKLRLVEALQRAGHVVAMTGDGVNDAPSLKQADVGVAMGKVGTEVAKDSAEMVLTDDDFATIQAAVEEGRGVFDNLRKFVVWTLPTNIGEGLVILAAILLATSLPILPAQILWINMTSAIALGLMLAFEPKEPGIMDRPPRDPARPLLTADLIVRMVIVSSIMVVAAFLLFEWELGRGVPIEEARTTACNVFVFVEILYLFNCRSLERSMFQIGLFSNRWILVGVSIMTALQLSFIYASPMNTLFSTAPVSLESWALVLGVSVGAYVVIEFEKRLRRQMGAKRPEPYRRERRPQEESG